MRLCQIKIMKKEKILIGFSGGKTSAYMTYQMIKKLSDKYEFLIVFANTGKEREETLQFVNECDVKWNLGVVWIEAITNKAYGKGVSAKVVDFKNASRNGEPFEAMIAKHGIPNVKNPCCTRELKTRAIIAYARSIGWKNKDYKTAIGIRVDEIDRVRKKNERHIYPLISWLPTNKEQINSWWLQQEFNLKLSEHQGNCDLCFKKTIRKLLTLIKEDKRITNWWIQIENKYKEFIPPGRVHNPKIKPPLHFFRDNTSTRQLIELSKKPFTPFRENQNYQTNLVELIEKIDESNGCEESCEPF